MGIYCLIDPDLIAELRGYTRDDLMDKDEDVRLTTRHFDLLMACAIAWQMRFHAEPKRLRRDEQSTGMQSVDFDVYVQ